MIVSEETKRVEKRRNTLIKDGKRSVADKIRENCGKEALVALNHRNAPLCMAQCGSMKMVLLIYCHLTMSRRNSM